MQKLNEEKENCMEIEKLDTRTLNNGTSMPIGKNFFRAKLKDREQWIEGFYCRINETTYCTTDDYQKEPVKVQHLIATERSTDWGMPNQIAFYEIDPATLCQYTGISKKYKKIWENDIISHRGIYAPIRYGEYQSSFDSTKTAHIGFFVDWEDTSKPLNRKDLGYWLKSTDATIVGNPCYYDFEIYSEASTTGGRRKTQNYENRAVHFYRCAGILRSMLYALRDHVIILSTNLQYFGDFVII